MRPYYITDQPLRFTDKSTNVNERENFANYFNEQIGLYGQSVEYYSYRYELSAHDPIYGEHPSAKFKSPVNIVMYVDLSEQSLFLSKFGLQGDDDVTAFIPISSFYNSMSATVGVERPEPKSGDVIKLTEFGDDRPGGRDGKMFEITQRLDQEVSQINPLMGHTLWLLKAKRLSYSFEPSLSAEGKSDQVHDTSSYGRLSGYENPVTDPSPLSGDDIDAAAKDVWDYTAGEGDDVYGDYY